MRLSDALLFPQLWLILYLLSVWLIENFMGKSGSSPHLDTSVLFTFPGFLPDWLCPLFVAVDHVTWLLSSSFSTWLTVSSCILYPCLFSKQLPTTLERMVFLFLSKPNSPPATGPYYPFLLPSSGLSSLPAPGFMPHVPNLWCAHTG